MLKDARTLRHLDRLHEQLRSAVPEPVLREALIHLWYLSRLMLILSDFVVGEESVQTIG
jgi:hypothetical protein